MHPHTLITNTHSDKHNMNYLENYQSKYTPQQLLHLYRAQPLRGAAKGAAKGTVTAVAPLAAKVLRIVAVE